MQNEVVDNLLRKIDQLEREQKRLNITIKGLSCSSSTVQAALSNLLREVFGLNDVLQSVRFIPLNGRSSNIVIVQLNAPETKSHILKNKKKLRSIVSCKNVYIEKDLTSNEHKIAQKIGEIARAARDDKKKVFYSHNWICIDDSSFRWDDQTQK